MPTNIMPLALSWGALTLIVIGLAFYKKRLDEHIHNHMHVHASDGSSLQGQVAEVHKCEVVERWGKLLTVAVVLYGLAILGILVYHQWQLASTVGFR